MNYLVIEGYKDATESFTLECGLKPNIDLESINDRMKIRTALQDGDVDSAMQQVNDLDEDILDSQPALLFQLQRQKLIELIRQGKVSEAIEFAQEELAPKGEEHVRFSQPGQLTQPKPEFLPELEKTMALLAFTPDTLASSPLASLLDMGQRQKTAGELNAAILTSQQQDKDPKLPALLKLMLWGQNLLDEKVHFPKMSLDGQMLDE
jgi:hypothetical protein